MKRILHIAILGILLVSCTEVEHNLYEVDQVNVNDDSATKGLKKSDLQLMSIMFTDVFGRSISQNELQNLADVYNSFGDKQVIIDRLTWNMVNDAGADLPDQTMYANNPEGLVNLLFTRYYSREPNEMEVWYYTNWMQENPNLEVKHLAFVLLSSEEYKYY